MDTVFPLISFIWDPFQDITFNLGNLLNLRNLKMYPYLQVLHSDHEMVSSLFREELLGASDFECHSPCTDLFPRLKKRSISQPNRIIFFFFIIAKSQYNQSEHNLPKVSSSFALLI